MITSLYFQHWIPAETDFGPRRPSWTRTWRYKSWTRSFQTLSCSLKSKAQFAQQSRVLLMGHLQGAGLLTQHLPQTYNALDKPTRSYNIHRNSATALLIHIVQCLCVRFPGQSHQWLLRSYGNTEKSIHNTLRAVVGLSASDTVTLMPLQLWTDWTWELW